MSLRTTLLINNLSFQVNQLQKQVNELVLSGPVQNPVQANIDVNGYELNNVGTIICNDIQLNEGEITGVGNIISGGNLTCADIGCQNIDANGYNITCNTLNYTTLNPQPTFDLSGGGNLELNNLIVDEYLNLNNTTTGDYSSQLHFNMPNSKSVQMVGGGSTFNMDVYNSSGHQSRFLTYNVSNDILNIGCNNNTLNPIPLITLQNVNESSISLYSNSISVGDSTGQPIISTYGTSQSTSYTGYIFDSIFNPVNYRVNVGIIRNGQFSTVNLTTAPYQSYILYFTLPEYRQTITTLELNLSTLQMSVNNLGQSSLTFNLYISDKMNSSFNAGNQNLYTWNAGTSGNSNLNLTNMYFRYIIPTTMTGNSIYLNISGGNSGDYQFSNLVISGFLTASCERICSQLVGYNNS